MFTGIVEPTGKVISLKKEKSNLRIGIGCSFAKELNIGQSIAHNGVCLTVERLLPGPSPKENGAKAYLVTAVKETLQKTNLGTLKIGSIVNLERSLKIGDRLDGHFVQGHVDTTATCAEIKKEKGSWIFQFGVQPSEFEEKNLIVDKGSICVNGVSLTIVNVFNSQLLTSGSQLYFSAAIIPHTFKHTNFSTLKKGDAVNIEFDILGKHIEKILSTRLK
ncbi:MAG: riboflavin synthase [Bacteroidetes bacterium]|nr:MAG: riboflavin synthase [Bacteroidota bacterium]